MALACLAVGPLRSRHSLRAKAPIENIHMRPRADRLLIGTTRERLSRVFGATLFVGAVAAAAIRLDDNSGAASHEALTLIAIFFAALISSIAGFAFSALAAAMLVHVYDSPTDMVRVLLVSSIAVQLYCSLRILPAVEWPKVRTYLLGGLLTMPLGVLLLEHAEPHAYTLGLGTFLVAYAVYALARPFTIRVDETNAIRICVGALGGISGGLAAFPGAFVVIWCSARGLDKHAQRAICQPYILAMQVATLAFLEIIDRDNTEGLLDLWSIVPVAVLAAYLGFSLFQRISSAQFKPIVLTLLAVSGALLVAKGL